MADEKPSSDFDFKSLIWDGAKSLGTSGATAIAEWGAAWALNKVGIQVGFEKKDKEKQQLMDELGQIDDELESIDQNIQVLSDEVSELTGLVEQLGSEIPMDINEGNLSNYTSTIGTVFTALRTVVSTASTDDKIVTSQLELLETSSNDVTQALSHIVALLCDNPSSGNLLDQWVNNMIQKGATFEESGLSQPTVSFMQLYLYVERNFLNTVHTLFKGYAYILSYNIAAEAFQHKPNGGGISLENPLTDSEKSAIQQKIADNQIAVGNSYMDNTVGPNLQKIADYFEYSIQRLLLSQYRAYNSGAFAEFQPGGLDRYLKLTVDDTVGIILTRSQLLHGLISGGEQVISLDDGTEVASLGVSQTSYLKPSDISSGEGPAINPGGGLGSSHGVLLAAPSTSGQPWYKVIDFLSDGTIASYRDSDIQVVQYSWPDAAINPGQAVGSNGHFSSLKAVYYNKFTLDPVEAPSEDEMQNVVLYAHTEDRSAIAQAGVFDLEDLQWTFDGDADDSFFTSTHSQHNPAENGTYVEMDANLTTSQNTVPSDDIDYAQTGSVEITFADSGPQDESDLVFGLIGELDVTITNHTHWGSGSVPMSTNAAISIYRGSMQIHNAPYGPVDHQGGSSSDPVVVNQNFNVTQIVTTSSGQAVQPGVSYTINAEIQQVRQKQGTVVPNSSNNVHGTAQLQFSSIVVAWAQPMPTN